MARRRSPKRIPPFRLVARPLDEEAKAMPICKWAGKDKGKRHKLGGDPDWMQPEDWPECPDCEQKMIFWGQFDSINDEFIIGDCGMVFVFVCLDCFESEAIVQFG